MIEFEMRLITKVAKLIEMSEGLIKHCIQHILTNYQQQLRFLESFAKSNIFEKLNTYLSTPFVQIRHAEAVTMMLEDSTAKLVEFNELPSYSSDLGSEHERYLTDTKYKVPVVVTRYPKAVKAFYMPVVQETPEESYGVEHVDCFDILVPGVGELVGGSMRIWNVDELIERINKLALDTKPLEDYINLRRYGSVPHGGMGMGFERLVSFVTGIGNVKDCVAYPRYMDCGK
jgi:asparaginyl-tRNA synthetase